ncbi:phytanoyl-CoA dioxygenase family protein [Singulisphaera sp. PoT]|uniref:phytanoyl-CoA dioxygenase family protein n=1 Tax=Singulisphaera sp. PoT TaxID=3411797 RepID=UPI003BF49873
MADWSDHFDRDGYAVVPDVLDDDAIEHLGMSLERLEASDTSLEREGRVYAARNLLQLIPDLSTLAATEPLIGLARRILGDRAFVVRALLFDKTPEANWLVPWHQDLTIAVKTKVAEAEGYGPWTRKGGIPHVQPPVEVLERMVTLRVHLDAAGSDNGPLRVVPGSHASGRLNAEATREWIDRVGPRECCVERGSVVVMRPMILHASSPAKAPDRRRVVHIEYAADALPRGVEWFEAEN